MTDTEIDLLERIVAGDESAMDAVLDRHWEAIVRYAFGFLGDWDRAEDVAQRTFVKLWAHRDRWSKGSMSALLHRIARNASFDVLRSPRHRSRVEMTDVVPGDDAIDQEIEATQLRDAARLAVKQLPARRQEVFRLAREGGFSYAEIAGVMGISKQTVANQMSLALKDLRVLLGPFLSSETMSEDAEAPIDDRQGGAE